MGGVYIHQYVPSQTYYLKHGQMDYLDTLCDERELDNPSQALQTIVSEHMETHE